MAAGALFNKLMIVELPLLLLAITLLPAGKLLPGGEVQTLAAAAADDGWKGMEGKRRELEGSFVK